ncbi:MAG: hypothetical protein APF84_12235 [Gracilibacter sp. BRH_c7a]|nr:MAG: hypothetical protein APF84_12235 [Gracilibacter sp. BRH_c7a]
MRKLVIAIIIGWVMLLLFRYEGLFFIENLFADTLTTQTREVDPRIKIIAIDEESLEKIGSWPWSRGDLADLADTLASSGATAVWPNLLFTEKSADPNQDKELAQVIAKYDNIYLPVYFDFEVLTKTKEEIEQEYLKLPVVDIPMERIGHINVLGDKDNVVRKLLPGVPTLDEEIVPSIDIILANLLLPESKRITWNEDYFWFKGEEPILLDEKLQIGLSYSSPPQDPQFDIIPAWKVIEGETDAKHFENSIVMIGLYATDQADHYLSPFSKEQMNSVEIHANSIQAIIEDKLYNKLTPSYGAFLVLLVGMLSFTIFELLSKRVGAIVLILSIVGYTVFVPYYYSVSQVLLPYSYTIFALLFAFGSSIIERYLAKRKGLKGNVI